MYQAHYGFRTDPFHITPDAGMVYLSKTHREAIGALDYGLRMGKGFIVITGEVGTGKTTVLRHSLRKLDPEKAAIAYVLQPGLSPRQLMALIWQELSDDPRQAFVTNLNDMGELARHLLFRLLALHQAGRMIVIVIDEAQTMPVETLESLRLLSNLESDKEKFVQIVLVGQPELDDKLALHELRQLKQRVAVRAQLTNLTPAESLGYLRYRIQATSGRAEEPFTNGALNYIVAKAEGNPRRLNIFCDNALINGLGFEAHTVDRDIVEEALAPHLLAEGPRHPPLGMSSQARTMALSIFALVGIGFLIGLGLQMLPSPTNNTPGSAREAGYSRLGASIDSNSGVMPSAYTQGPAMTSPAPTATAPPPTLAAWTVKKGETLDRICARAYGLCSRTMVQTLAQANPKLNPLALEAGQRVTLPVIENLRPIAR